MQCPKCGPLGLPATHFCTQECFSKSWKPHNRLHKARVAELAQAKAAAEYTPPPFDYTGTVRPAYVTPMRQVPSHIMAPDYQHTGYPLAESQLGYGVRDILIYTEQEIETIREAGRIGRELLDLAGNAIRVGITTEDIDLLVHNRCVELNAYPSPLNYHGFPKACCTSVNEIICHGIPDARPLENGDIVNVDISVSYKGLHSDLNETFLVGEVDDASKNLIKVAHDCLELAMQHAKPGVMFREFGGIISRHAQKNKCSVVKSYCGHGVGRHLHCAPNVPHYAKNKAIGVLKPGMIFTIEPMINLGHFKDVTWPDNWTSATVDGRRSAQFEHTMLVTEDGIEVLTARTPQSVPFWWE